MPEGKQSLKAAELWLKHLKTKCHTLRMRILLASNATTWGNYVVNGFSPVT